MNSERKDQISTRRDLILVIPVVEDVVCGVIPANLRTKQQTGETRVIRERSDAKPERDFLADVSSPRQPSSSLKYSARMFRLAYLQSVCCA